MRHQEGAMNRAEPLTYSVDEVAELLGIARGVAYECVRNGSIPATRVGRRWLVSRKRFHAWLEGAGTASTAGRGNA
jgi:excisionase family DNA binding protein